MKPKDKLLLGTTITVGVMVVIGAIISGLYWLVIQAGEEGARWWAILATLALPATVIITWRLATHSTREHLAGFERGLTGAQKTIETISRSLMTTSPTHPTRTVARPVQDDSDLLPKVGNMRLIDAPLDDEMIDL